VLFATIPLVTQLLASLNGQERLTGKGMLGATIVIVGIAVVFLEQLKFDTPLIYMAAILAAVLSTALSGIVVKYFRGATRLPQMS
jgi:drug/metabolite transporter (DMT)-like permease